MITITSKLVPMLVDCYGFCFETENLIEGEKDFSEQDQQTQEELVGQICETIEALCDEPCEIDITIGFKDGMSVYDGNISSYDQSLRDIIIGTLTEVKMMLYMFNCIFPDSEFILRVTQSFTIISVDPALNLN